MTPWVDMLDLDRDAFALLGLTPREVDRYSFRDLWTMFAGARKREKVKWEHTAMIVQSVMNHGGNGLLRPQPLTALHEKMFGRAVSTDRPNQDRLRSILRGASTRKEQ